MSPEVNGLPIEITFAPALRAHRGKLLSGKSSPGKEVHAASLIRQRRIVLDAELKKKPAELKRILIHELFHFAWLRLGNPGRRSFEELLRKEVRERVRGELGWSAEQLKLAASPARLRRSVTPLAGVLLRKFLRYGRVAAGPDSAS